MAAAAKTVASLESKARCAIVWNFDRTLVGRFMTRTGEADFDPVFKKLRDIVARTTGKPDLESKTMFRLASQILEHHDAMVESLKKLALGHLSHAYLHLQGIMTDPASESDVYASLIAELAPPPPSDGALSIRALLNLKLPQILVTRCHYLNLMNAYFRRHELPLVAESERLTIDTETPDATTKSFLLGAIRGEGKIRVCSCPENISGKGAIVSLYRQALDELGMSEHKILFVDHESDHVGSVVWTYIKNITAIYAEAKPGTSPLDPSVKYEWMRYLAATIRAASTVATADAGSSAAAGAGGAAGSTRKERPKVDLLSDKEVEFQLQCYKDSIPLVLGDERRRYVLSLLVKGMLGSIDHNSMLDIICQDESVYNPGQSHLN